MRVGLQTTSKHGGQFTRRSVESEFAVGDPIPAPRLLRDRFNSLSAAASSNIIDDLTIEPGALSDYQRLARFHYKSAHPGVVTSVLRVTHRRPTVIGRYLQRLDETQLAGVLVRSLPALSCRARDIATGNRYGGLKPREAAIMLNRQVRTISRVVIDPPWRGAGLAVRLVRFALKHPEPEVQLTEALAAMGRVSPFFERAGMQRYDRPVTAHEGRLLDALEQLSIAPAMLACPRLITAWIDQMNEARRHWIQTEIRRWHRAAHRTPTQELSVMSLDDLLRAARQKLLAQPVYYAFQHEPQLQPQTHSHDETQTRAQSQTHLDRSPRLPP